MSSYSIFIFIRFASLSCRSCPSRVRFWHDIRDALLAFIPWLTGFSKPRVFMHGIAQCIVGRYSSGEVREIPLRGFSPLRFIIPDTQLLFWTQPARACKCNESSVLHFKGADVRMTHPSLILNYLRAKSRKSCLGMFGRWVILWRMTHSH